MNAVKIIENAKYSLEHNTITSGEYDRIVKPLEDVEPVRHGHWIKGGEAYIEAQTIQEHICSICGNRTLEADNYCGGCGAKMDEEAER